MQKKIKSRHLIWIDIILTLSAIVVMEYFYYGIRAVVLCGACVASSLCAEIIALRFTKRRFTADGLSCISDAVIISLMIPVVLDYTVAAAACIFASALAKNALGGNRKMIFSPAAVGYVFLLTSWKSEISMFTQPHTHTGIFEKAEGFVSSSSHEFNISGRMECTDFEMIMGNVSGAAGAVSILLLAVAAFVLILRRDISIGAFIGTILGTAIPAVIVPVCEIPTDSLKYTLCTNMILFSAIYIISDKRIAPEHSYYSFFYGFFIALVSYVIVINTAKENAIVVVSVLFAPAALGFKNFERKIDEQRQRRITDELTMKEAANE